MKKLMIAAAAIATAVVANAAQVTWNTGAIKIATDKDGAFGTETAASTSGNKTITASIWLLSEATLSKYATITDTKGVKKVTAVDSEKLYNAIKDGTLGAADNVFNNTNPSTGANVAAASWADNNGGTGYSNEKVYAALLLEYTDKSLNENGFYIANAAAANVAASNVTVANLATKIGGTGTTITGWTVAPEPTSGLLLLLGMAGLALKRKRA